VPRAVETGCRGGQGSYRIIVPSERDGGREEERKRGREEGRKEVYSM
jgi:hypothetical protein